MPSILNDALEWLDGADQVRDIAEQLSDPDTRRAVIQLAERFERLARAAAALHGGAKKGSRHFSRPLLGLTASAPRAAVENGSTPGSLTPEEHGGTIEIQNLLMGCFVELSAPRKWKLRSSALLREKNKVERRPSHATNRNAMHRPVALVRSPLP